MSGLATSVQWHTLRFAEGFDRATEGASNFWTSGVGGMLQAVLGAIAVLILVGAAFASIRHFTKGDPGTAFKIILGSVVAAVFLFAPQMFTTLLEGAATLMGALVGSIGDVLGSGG